MLNVQIKNLLRELNAQSKDIAECAGCSPANFCRMRSGSRVYTKDSRTVKKFADGVYEYCLRTNRTKELRELVGCTAHSPERVKAALIKWLFTDEPLPLPEDPHMPDAITFGRKLSELIKLSEISASKLSRELNIDSSYISRLRNGERIPQKSTRLVKKLCQSLAVRIAEQGKIDKLAELLDVSTDILNETNIGEQVYIWLYSSSLPTSVRVIKELIASLNSLPEEGDDDLPDISQTVTPEVLDDRAENYSCDSGLQKAVIRFLGNAVNIGSGELMLYSDMGIDWMMGDFLATWSALMKACIAKGIKIKIIHNVDRNSTEMLMAIKSWLPLYMSGLIESYYCTRSLGERFSCTIFLNPDEGCVTGFSFKELAHEAEYRYITDKKSLDVITNTFEAMLKTSKPLVKINKSTELKSGNFSIYSYGNLQLCIGDGQVVINKLGNPRASFTLTHPMMCKAFKDFAQTYSSSEKGRR